MGQEAGGEQEPELEACTVRFASARSNVVARVCWVTGNDTEVEYARLWPGCWFNQPTYTTHPWRLRDAETGALLAEYVGGTATVTLLSEGGVRCEPGLRRPPPADIVDERWGAWRLRGAAAGCIPIWAFDCVCLEAVCAAEHVVESMLRDADPAVLSALVDSGAELAIIGREQSTCDLPMYRHLRGVSCGNGGGSYDEATRGLGGNPGCPTTSCGEENLLLLPGDRYRHENVLVHEFGHAVMDLGLPPSLRAEIDAAYQAAQAAGSYDPSCYMMANASEYWAEGSQAWFEATVREDVTSGVNTRQKLRARDPALAALMLRVYGDGSWRYPATAPQQWPHWREQQQQQQQQGAGKIATVGPSAAAEPQVQPVASRKRSRRRVSGGSGGMQRLMAGPRRITRSLARLASSCLPSASMRS
ncbi:hypothetical protein COHA_008648 [Chlorella ohadii]|uniref:Uncharacterized protein n=1 Tax=Chlorella ohadii TaxID=2649997 RepID=A0AAD5DGB2_9CHLO|nr:hypothetical protein COHA_008648 [Chlorella ohadii]